MQLRWWATWQAIEPPTPTELADLLATRVLPRSQAFTVLIPARNEAANISACLHRVQQAAQNSEVLVVDDHSTDATPVLAREAGASVSVLPKGEQGKKAALNHGIAQATTPWIATLDADVAVGARWLDAINAHTYPERVAVAGPVMLEHDNSWWQRWQALDFCGMMAITAASLEHGHFAMGNGANLAFDKSAFAEVDGYELPESQQSASGDDMVLLGKLIRRFPGRVAFAKTRDAVVTTRAQATVHDFVQQRLRWAAKTGLNHQASLTVVLGVVWVFHLGLLLGPLLAAVNAISWVTLGLCWLVKLIVDFVLLRSATRFFGRAKLLDLSYPLGSLVHTFYVAGVGTLALLPVDFTWKGRRLRH